MGVAEAILCAVRRDVEESTGRPAKLDERQILEQYAKMGFTEACHRFVEAHRLKSDGMEEAEEVVRKMFFGENHPTVEDNLRYARFRTMLLA